MQRFLPCKVSFMHFLNYIPYYAWVCFLTLAQTKIATLFRRLTGSCQTLKTEQRCQRQFPRERRTLVLLFKNTEDGVFLPRKCCRRCPLLLLHKVAASGETFKKEVNFAALHSGQRVISSVYVHLKWKLAAGNVSTDQSLKETRSDEVDYYRKHNE